MYLAVIFNLAVWRIVGESPNLTRAILKAIKPVTIIMVNKNSLAVKKVRGQSEATMVIHFNSLQGIYWLCHLATLYIKDDGTKRWPSDKANHSCENAL